MPDALDRIIGRCLQREPSARWQTMEALGEALRWLRDSSTSTAHAVSAATAPRTRRRWWVTGAGALVIAAASLAMGWTLSARRRDRPPPRMVTDLDLPPELGAPFDTVFEIAQMDMRWSSTRSRRSGFAR